MQAVALRGLSGSATPPELPSVSASYRGGKHAEAGDAQSFAALFGEATASSPMAGAPSHAGESPTHGNRPGEPDLVVPLRSQAHPTAAKGADQGLSTPQAAGKISAAKQMPPPKLLSSALSGSPKPSASSSANAPNIKNNIAAKQSGGSRIGSLRIAPVVAPDGLTAAQPASLLAGGSSSTGDWTVSGGACGPPRGAISGDGRHGLSDEAGAAAHRSGLADTHLPDSPAPQDGAARPTGDPSNLRLPAATGAGSGASESGALPTGRGERTADILRGNGAAPKDRLPTAALKLNGNDSSANAGLLAGEKQDVSIANSRRAKSGRSGKDSEAEKAGRDTAPAARVPDPSGLNGLTSQAMNAARMSPNVTPNPGQSLGNSAFARKQFWNSNTTVSSKANQNNELTAFGGLSAAPNLGQANVSSSAPVAAPIAQTAVAAQVGQQAFERQPAGLVALLRVENEGGTGRAVVSTVGEGLRAVLLPSSDAAFSIAQAQVPYLREAIASFGFAADAISVSVNQDSAGREQGDSNYANQKPTARLGAAGKPYEIFITQEGN